MMNPTALGGDRESRDAACDDDGWMSHFHANASSAESPIVQLHLRIPLLLQQTVFRTSHRRHRMCGSL